MTLLALLPILFFTAMIAGFVDTLAGGGGMLSIPALLMAGLPPDQALATNKMQGTVGTTSACWYFLRRKELHWSQINVSLITSCLGAVLGALAILFLDKGFLEHLIPALLMAIAIVMLTMPQIGSVEKLARQGGFSFAVAFALPIGFYDGFFGPGTGTFFMLALVAMRGLTIQQATIRAKALNMASNFVALLVFLFHGKIVWPYGLIMAGGQILGARIASAMIIRKGNKLIRPLVIAMSMIISCVLAVKYWFR